MRKGVLVGMISFYLLASGCGPPAKYGEGPGSMEKTREILLQNKPNRTGETVDTETSQSPWWFY